MSSFASRGILSVPERNPYYHTAIGTFSRFDPETYNPASLPYRKKGIVGEFSPHPRYKSDERLFVPVDFSGRSRPSPYDSAMSKRSYADAYSGVSDAALLAAYPSAKRRYVSRYAARPARMSKAMYASAGAQAYRRSAARARLLANTRTGGFLGIETKFFDSTLAATTLGTTIAGGEKDPATDNCLNAIVQGDGPSNRDGNRYIVKRVTVKGEITLPALADGAAAPEGDTMFVALVQDKQTNGAQLNAEDVFTGDRVPYPFRDQEFLSRFHVLESHTMPMAYTGGTPSAGGDRPGLTAPFSFDKALNMKVQCNGTTGPIATITDNSLHIVAFSKFGLGNISYNSRVLFVG